MDKIWQGPKKYAHVFMHTLRVLWFLPIVSSAAAKEQTWGSDSGGQHCAKGHYRHHSNKSQFELWSTSEKEGVKALFLNSSTSTLRPYSSVTVLIWKISTLAGILNLKPISAFHQIVSQGTTVNMWQIAVCIWKCSKQPYCRSLRDMCIKSMFEYRFYKGL